MCMLTVFPMPDLVDSKTIGRLDNGAQLNDDGHGWAVVSEGRILTGKSMSAELAIMGFEEAYRKATGPALFHSRWATHGTTDIDNVHPFPVRKVRSTYVAHNGILSKEAQPTKGDKRSDTRIFADEIMPRQFSRLDSARVRSNLEDWLGFNKIAVLTTNRRYRRNLYLFNMYLGEWVDGVWFSNSDHEGYKYRWGAGTGTTSTTIGSHAATTEDKDGNVLNGADAKANLGIVNDDECVWCHNETINDLDVCETCGTCQDCWEPQRECQCYVPSLTKALATLD